MFVKLSGLKIEMKEKTRSGPGKSVKAGIKAENLHSDHLIIIKNQHCFENEVRVLLYGVPDSSRLTRSDCHAIENAGRTIEIGPPRAAHKYEYNKAISVPYTQTTGLRSGVPSPHIVHPITFTLSPSLTINPMRFSAPLRPRLSRSQREIGFVETPYLTANLSMPLRAAEMILLLRC